MTDEINNPSHYMLFPDMQAIDVIEAVLSPVEFAGYLKGNALKYRLRAGDKGPAETCLGKAEWYQDRLFQHYDGMGWSEDLNAMDEKEFGQQNTFDYRDPRTVAGVDVSFPTEKHMNLAPECEHVFDIDGWRETEEASKQWFRKCSKCGVEVERE